MSVDPDEYEYIVKTDYKGTGERTMLQWTTEPPTQEGWYWAKDKHNIQSIVYVEKDLLVTLIGREESFPRTDFIRWLGPLPVPESPKDVNDKAHN